MKIVGALFGFLILAVVFVLWYRAYKSIKGDDSPLFPSGRGAKKQNNSLDDFIASYKRGEVDATAATPIAPAPASARTSPAAPAGASAVAAPAALSAPRRTRQTRSLHFRFDQVGLSRLQGRASRSSYFCACATVRPRDRRRYRPGTDAQRRGPAGLQCGDGRGGRHRHDRCRRRRRAGRQVGLSEIVGDPLSAAIGQVATAAGRTARTALPDVKDRHVAARCTTERQPFLALSAARGGSPGWLSVGCGIAFSSAGQKASMASLWHQCALNPSLLLTHS